MPSIEQLEQFSKIFSQIAREDTDSSGFRSAPLALPTQEASPRSNQPPGKVLPADEPSGSDALVSPLDEDIDLNSLLDSIGDNIGVNLGDSDTGSTALPDEPPTSDEPLSPDEPQVPDTFSEPTARAQKPST